LEGSEARWTKFGGGKAAWVSVLKHLWFIFSLVQYNLVLEDLLQKQYGEASDGEEARGCPCPTTPQGAARSRVGTSALEARLGSGSAAGLLWQHHPGVSAAPLRPLVTVASNLPLELGYLKEAGGLAC